MMNGREEDGSPVGLKLIPGYRMVVLRLECLILSGVLVRSQTLIRAWFNNGSNSTVILIRLRYGICCSL